MGVHEGSEEVLDGPPDPGDGAAGGADRAGARVAFGADLYAFLILF